MHDADGVAAATPHRPTGFRSEDYMSGFTDTGVSRITHIHVLGGHVGVDDNAMERKERQGVGPDDIPPRD